MRSVVIYLRNTTAQEVVRLLDRICPAQKGPPWIWERDGDPCLYVQCTSGGAYDFSFEREIQESVVAALGGPPHASVLADVAGRHPGDAEVRALLSALLGTFHGVAQDEYTSHSWTLEQVLSGAKVEGHGFFDHRGWVEQNRRK
jgi:hypothetical protein